MRTTHPFYCPPEMLIYFDLTINLVGGANVVWFVSLLFHRAIHTSLWTSQTSADHEQGAWSATRARSLVKRCVHFIVPLLGNAQYGIAYFLSTRNNPYFSKISFSKLIPLKETKTHISSLLYYNVFIIENNQWKFEQNRGKNKEVRDLWNLAISRGRYSKWWQVVDNSPYVLYMKFHVFPLFWWLRQYPSLKSRYDKQGCILHCILWSRAMKTCVSKENFKRVKFCVQNEWRVVHNNCPHNLITALYCSLELKML